mmetsp:Transcript_82715/g.221809  ORF Transcript_82715/g.221809 Transcript_82715/m.221809 type:complete len:216 (-) Transcript_82715:1908-2555(-)
MGFVGRWVDGRVASQRGWTNRRFGWHSLQGFDQIWCSGAAAPCHHLRLPVHHRFLCPSRRVHAVHPDERDSGLHGGHRLRHRGQPAQLCPRPAKAAPARDARRQHPRAAQQHRPLRVAGLPYVPLLLLYTVLPDHHLPQVQEDAHPLGRDPRLHRHHRGIRQLPRRFRLQDSHTGPALPVLCQRLPHHGAAIQCGTLHTDVLEHLSCIVHDKLHR